MNSTWTVPSDDGDDAYKETQRRRAKRRKTNTGKAVLTKNRATFPALLDAFRHGLAIHANEPGFDSTMHRLLPEYLEERQLHWARSSTTTLPNDIGGTWGKQDESESIRPLSHFESARILASAKQRMAGRAIPPSECIALRQLQLHHERRQAGIRPSPLLMVGVPPTLAPLDMPPSTAIPHVVLDALRAIRTTRYEHSFAARLYGPMHPNTPGLIAVDWESRAPWTLLMDDIHAHHALAHPERDRPERSPLPITYVSLQSSHLCQVHGLLARAFWEGIDVSDTLHYAPERCTVIAMYGHLVVGAALLSSPQETYITYLAVRAGWENAQIATTMLYHLIALHPHRDITLHVSANNPAMLLYNRFGFKAEEFIAGFYEAYLDADSKASKNAFRLRLRR